MSRFRLPPEISDHVVDLLHKEPDALRMCCLVSKSWVSRAQKHLFRKVVFNSPSRLQAWRDTFPDPVNSPTNHTRSLRFTCEEPIRAALFGKGAWSQSFPNVVRLKVWVHEILGSALFELVCSLPHLEDLQIAISEVDDDFDDNTIFSLTSPPLTGALDLCVSLGMGSVVRRLLDLPNGIRFRKLEATVDYEEDLRYAIAVVEECSETLESIEIVCDPVNPRAGSIDFSEVINLKDVAFGLAGPEDVWIAMALETITSKHTDFRKVSITIQINPPNIDYPDYVRKAVGERVYRQWMDLDRVLFQLWESKKIYAKVIFSAGEVGDGLEYVVALLPEMTKRGLVDLVDDGYV
ncbi:hypothetical protein BJ322DRAFT_1208557 [Thelephora terrestris]|uniref:F-box domain-containing protein n=1 Tax=Thelephora terrestris TaxID=56493 RepID=A0A9P6HK99_9AGAM|nr:hypothetical protein BJ322DRAFT_1208557 [Thelephora terrestris]